MSRLVTVITIISVMLFAVSLSATAHAPSGAIFTTLENGTEVNLNHFDSKPDVYLDGGPGPGAPAPAAGLDDGTYVYQVTDPSGKVLLSEDKAKCRQVVASGGFFTAVVDVTDATCNEHALGVDSDHGAPPENARTVQLIPFANTPNNGGVYKAWVTRVEDFLLGCQELGHPGATGLELVDCGEKDGGNAHGFIPAHSKTDNFKVKGARLIGEIDVEFFRDTNGNGLLDAGEQPQLPGFLMIWTDTLGVTNNRFSDPEFEFGTFAHVESPEEGTHYITVPDQPGCTVTGISGPFNSTSGAGTVYVIFPEKYKNVEFLIYVGCAAE